MSELTQALIPYVLAPALALFILAMRPSGRRLAPIYGHAWGGVWLVVTWALAAAAIWASFKVSERSIVLATVIVMIAPLAAGTAFLAYRDARRGKPESRPFRD